MLELIIILIGVILAVSILVYLLKLSIKIGIALVVAYFIFHVGFLWDYDSFNDKVPVVEEYLLPEYAEGFKKWYYELNDKRYEHAMLDIDKMEADIDIAIKNAIEKSKNKYDSVDKEELVANLYSELKEKDYGKFEDELIKFKDEITSNGLSEAEYNEVISKLNEMTDSVNNINSRLDKIEEDLNNIE